MKGVLEVFKRFKSYYKDYIPQFCLAALGMIMASVGTAVSAWLVKPVLDYIFIEKNANLLYLLPAAIIAIYFIKSAGTFMQAYFTAYIGQDTVRRFRYKLLGILLYLDLGFFNKFRTGELISRNTNDVERIRSIVSSLLPEFLREFITIIGLLVVVIYQSPKLAVLALIVFPLTIYPLSRLAKKMKKLSKKAQEKTSDISAVLSEIFTNIEIIKANNAENKELSRFDEHNHNFFNINLKGVRINELVSPLMETAGSIGVAVVIIVGGKEVIEGQMSVGSFFSFLTALFMLYTPIKRISTMYNKMQDAVAASERTFELLDKTPDILGGGEKFPNLIHEVNFQNILFKYGDKNVLNGVNLRAQKGQMIAIAGTSGGGKTSLVNLLLRFYDPSGGNILINDKNICEFALTDLRANIGLVSQRVYIFNDTIAQNVAYGGEFNEERVINALKMANAYEFVKNLNSGIYEILDEFGANLSGGQRQRIAIARALYKNPQILIFDEATSALDNESERNISDVISTLRKDKIIFVIAHRLSTIRTADKIAVIDGGKIVGFGDEETLLRECEVYKKLREVN